MPTADYIPGQTECIHLTYPDKNGKIPTRRYSNGPVQTTGENHTLACDPVAAVFPKIHSTETEAVNCPACKATEAFKRIQAEQSGAFNHPADKAAYEFALKRQSDASLKDSQTDVSEQLKQEQTA